MLNYVYINWTLEDKFIHKITGILDIIIAVAMIFAAPFTLMLGMSFYNVQIVNIIFIVGCIIFYIVTLILLIMNIILFIKAKKYNINMLSILLGICGSFIPSIILIMYLNLPDNDDGIFLYKVLVLGVISAIGLSIAASSILAKK